MRIFAQLLAICGVLWLLAAGLVISIALLRIALNDGFGALQGVLSPFNVMNFIATAVALAPGLGLLWLAKRLDPEDRRGDG